MGIKVGLVLLLSHTHERFERAHNLLKHVGFEDAIYMPAVFVKKTDERCRGNNGHRLAFRNMWRLMVRTSHAACIFEDDIALTNQNFRAQNVHMDADLIFLGEYWKRGRWWTNHAACLNARTAQILLQNTKKCIRGFGTSIDRIIKKLCNEKLVRCKRASLHSVVIDGQTWWGDFHQNRSIPSFLHDAHNNAINRSA